MVVAPLVGCEGPNRPAPRTRPADTNVTTGAVTPATAPTSTAPSALRPANPDEPPDAHLDQNPFEKVVSDTPADRFMPEGRGRLAAAALDKADPANGIGPRGPLFGNGGNATRIVFVCPASGTMRSRLPSVKDQLKRAVMNLKPVQSFNIVFYYDGPKATSLDTRLVPATKDNQRRALKWLDGISPAGQTEARTAIRLAFKQNPDLVYYLTDGEFSGLCSYKDDEAEVAKCNPGGTIRVNTILIDEFDEETENSLRRMAKAAGGTYRFVKSSDLEQPK